MSPSTMSLAVIPRNPIFPAIHAAIVEWLVDQRHVTLNWRGRQGTAKVAYEAHAAIYEAIAERDADPAEQAMRNHLEHASGRLSRSQGLRAHEPLCDLWSISS